MEIVQLPPINRLPANIQLPSIKAIPPSKMLFGGAITEPVTSILGSSPSPLGKKTRMSLLTT